LPPPHEGILQPINGRGKPLPYIYGVSGRDVSRPYENRIIGENNMKLFKSKLLRNIVCVTLAVCLVVALLQIPQVSAPTKAAALKEEVIYVRLLNNGAVDEIYVVNSFTLDETHQITDYGNYSYVQNLTNMDTLRLKDGVVTIDTQDEKLYYEGFLMDAELPWEFAITYRLDGKETAPEELGGKNGHFEMEISSRFNPRGNREFFDKYCLQVSVSLDTGICNNVCADTGTIAAAGASKQINFIVLPGKDTVMELSADVVNFKMPAITIAGVTMNMDLDFDDVDMSDIRELIDGLVELDDGIKELLNGIFDMYDGVAELYDGSIEFADGMVDFEDGAAELLDGVGELKDGTAELKDGVLELADGTEELKDGVLELADGTDELQDGVFELADGTEDLRDGVSDLKDGVIEMADGMDEMYDGINELVDGVREFDDGMVEFKDGMDEFYDGLTELFEGTEELYDGLEEIVGGAKELNTGLSGIATNTSLIAGSGSRIFGLFDAYFDILLELVNTQLNGLLPSSMAVTLKRDNYKETITSMVTMLSNPLYAAYAAFVPQLTDVYAMLYGYEQLLDGLRDYTGGVGQIGAGISSLSGGMAKFTGGLEEYWDGFKEYFEGWEELYDGAEDLVDGVKKLADGSRELLDGVIELRDGAIEFRDGVIELRDGVIELYDGIVEMHNGVIELRDGVIELNDGVIELRDGVVELNDGVTELLDGAVELDDGVGELYDGVAELHDGSVELRDGAFEFRDGIAELLDGTNELYDGVDELKDGTGEIRDKTQSLDTDIVDGIKDTVVDMMGGEGPVKSFVSERNGEISGLQFLMQTEGISRPEPPKAEETEAPETTFWQRLLALF